MRALIVVLQLALTFVAVALTLPAIVVRMPAARDGVVGPALALTIFAVVFVAIRLMWPKRLS
jgi:hypothetical protein